jgi:hypothetical protein
MYPQSLRLEIPLHDRETIRIVMRKLRIEAERCQFLAEQFGGEEFELCDMVYVNIKRMARDIHQVLNEQKASARSRNQDHARPRAGIRQPKRLAERDGGID